MTLMTTGEIGSSVAWAVDENGTPLVPPATGTALNGRKILIYSFQKYVICVSHK
jgi:hypothetical protein